VVTISWFSRFLLLSHISSCGAVISSLYHSVRFTKREGLFRHKNVKTPELMMNPARDLRLASGQLSN
jgi:hypothetical protein